MKAQRSNPHWKPLSTEEEYDEKQYCCGCGGKLLTISKRFESILNKKYTLCDFCFRYEQDNFSVKNTLLFTYRNNYAKLCLKNQEKDTINREDNHTKD